MFLHLLYHQETNVCDAQKKNRCPVQHSSRVYLFFIHCFQSAGKIHLMADPGLMLDDGARPTFGVLFNWMHQGHAQGRHAVCSGCEDDKSGNRL